MSEQRIATAVLELKIDDRQYKFALAQVKKDSDDTATSVRGIGQAVNLAVFQEFGRIAVGAIRAVVGTIVELGQRGANVTDVAASFGVLSEKCGETAAVMLGELRAGTVGTISDVDLMTAANSALGAGLIKNAADMGTLAEGARALAKATGGETADAFDILTRAIASGRTASLKSLGIFVDSKVAIDDYAKSVGKTAGQLTDAERAAALSAATLAALRTRLQEIPPDAADFGEQIEQAKAKMANFTDQLSVAVSTSPVLMAGMRAMGSALDGAFGANQQETIKTILGLIQDLAVFAVDVAGVVVGAARLISAGWSGLQIVFNAVFLGMTAALGLVVDGLLKLASVPFANQIIPGISQAKEGLQELSDKIDGAKQSFADQAIAAVDSGRAHNEALLSIGAGLDTMRGAMVAAGNDSAVMGVKGADAIKGIGDAAGAAVPRTAAATATIAAAYQKLQDDILLGTKVGMDKRLAELAIGEQKEIAGIRELKEITATERDAMILLVQEKYRQQVDAARLGTDEIKALEQQLQLDIALLTTTGTANKLLTLDAARLKEIEGIAYLKENYSVQYAALLADIQTKYALMSAAASGHGLTVQQAAAAAGISTRAELQTTADNAVSLYERMKESGLFTTAAVLKAHEDAEAAKRVAKGQTAEYMMSSDEAIAAGALQVMGVLGEKNKVAAIAGAIINTYLAVTKALAAAPWPANLVLAAGALAVGMANVSRIRSSDAGGFKEGTPGFDFADFGPVSFQPLHGQEAVIPRGGGHALAGEIASSLPGGVDDARMARVVDALEALPASIRRAIRDGALMGAA